MTALSGFHFHRTGRLALACYSRVGAESRKIHHYLTKQFLNRCDRRIITIEDRSRCHASWKRHDTSWVGQSDNLGRWVPFSINRSCQCPSSSGPSALNRPYKRGVLYQKNLLQFLVAVFFSILQFRLKLAVAMDFETSPSCFPLPALNLNVMAGLYMAHTLLCPFQLPMTFSPRE